jgi:chromosome segregation and condensation protein ScpB
VAALIRGAQVKRRADARCQKTIVMRKGRRPTPGEEVKLETSQYLYEKFAIAQRPGTFNFIP